MRTTSLIVTVFGDVVSQHGHSIWLGSLVNALAPIGVSERLVRTSVFRLVQEGWLEFDRSGRRSYYRFSDYGAHEYGRAAPQIYGQDTGEWNGRWQLLIPLDLPDTSRERFKRSLTWQGFRTITQGTFAKPGSGGQAMLDCLEEFDALDKVIVMEADTLPQTSDRLLWDLVHENWHLDEVAVGYREFIRRFRPLLRWLKTARNHPCSVGSRPPAISSRRSPLLRAHC
jgi:phenylacetic acid degradation operon negative regulatory protein